MQGTYFVLKQRPNGLEGLQRAATHCNALQHTVTLCNTLQHTATHCNTLQHTATHCNTLQHAVNTLCNVTTSKHTVFTYSLLHLECHSISFANLNPIGLFSLKGSKRDVENQVIINWVLRLKKWYSECNRLYQGMSWCLLGTVATRVAVCVAVCVLKLEKWYSESECNRLIQRIHGRKRLHFR